MEDADKNIQDIFSDNLRKVLDDKGVSESELAERIGTSYKSISNYCNYHHLPTSRQLVSIADSLNISIDGLFGRKPSWSIGEGNGVFGVEDVERVRMIFQEAERQNRDANAELEYCEKRQQDILHRLEIVDLSYHESAKLSAELTEIRRRRRNAKNLLDITAPVTKWMNEQSGAMAKLSNVIGTLRKIEDRQKNAVYYIKTGEDAGTMLHREVK